MIKKYKKIVKLYRHKNSLSFNQVFNQAIEKSFGELNLDPIYDLLNNMDDINEILKFEKTKIIEFFYFNRKKIEQILYDNEEVIRINEDWIHDDTFSNFFYLSLLIRDNPTIINYIYDLDLIRNVNKKKKIAINKSYKYVLIEKVIFELINNYKGSDDYVESQEEELKGIEQENLISIENNIKIFNKFNLNFTMKDFLAEKIDSIYIKIIIFLIINKKFDNYKYVTDLLEELNLDSINITRTMFEQLNKELTVERNREVLEYYSIKDSKDLSDIKKINFFYILFTYILKDSIYIYYNDFLKTIRLNLIEIFKNIPKNEKETTNIKLKNIIDYFDLNYYYSYAPNKKKFKENQDEIDDKIQNHNSTKIENDIIQNQNSKKIENNKIQNLNQQDTRDITYSKCEEFEESKTLNKNNELTETDYSEFIKNIFNNSSFLLKNDQNKNYFITLFNDENTSKQMIGTSNHHKRSKNYDILLKNFKKFIEFLYNVKEKIKNEFVFNYNLIIKLSFSIEENNNNSNSIYNIKCIYYFYPPNADRIYSFKDENILIYGIDGIDQGFNFLINEINDSDYEKSKYDQSKDIYEIIKEKEKTIKKEKSENKLSILDIINSKDISPYKVIDFKKVVATHSNSVEFLKRLSNGYFISGGGRKLFILKKSFGNDYYKKEINLTYNPMGVCEIETNDKEQLKFISYSYENLNYINCESLNNVSIKSHKLSVNHAIYINDNKFIVNNIDGGFIYENLSVFDKKDLVKILKYSYYEGIKIYQDLFAFTSNKIMPNGKDTLIFYDLFRGKLYELEGHSFSINKNSLLLVKNNKTIDDKILICACTKYTMPQKNGLLFINTKFTASRELYDSFINTDNFQPYCLAQIYLVDTTNIKDNECNKKERKRYSTNYFFVGGFNEERAKGAIKLYKINFDNMPETITIEFVYDIILENEKEEFYGFNGAVTSIVQSFETGEFLISCSDGNICLFTPANINYFLYYDEQEKNELDYDEIALFDEKMQEEIDKNNEKQRKPIDMKTIFDNLLNEIKVKEKIPFDLSFFQ